MGCMARRRICRVAALMSAIFALVFSAGVSRAESAGELGRHYGVRYTMPIIIGPLRDLRQGKLPPPIVLDRPDTPDAGSGEAPGDGGEEAYIPFNPDLDFDEPLYADRAADNLSDLYAALHKKGSRVVYQINPLLKFPLEEVTQRVKSQAKKQARQPARTSAERKKKQAAGR
jgi:hypothetical protein